MDGKKSNWPGKYNPQAIEPKWQARWEAEGLYRTPEPAPGRKFYCLDFFPYPSGEGLHVGHCRNYVPTDVISRYKRMGGYAVLHPMGWDSFGEPAEQYAIAHGVHPRQTTDANTANYKRQMRLIGTSYDWTREIDSSAPEFYRWTQWFFLKLYERGLAYRDTNWQWWCPGCQTTLSSHEVNGGVCWRGHTGVTRREIPAWYFRITAYADELITGLDVVDWPESIKAMQRNWIGRSEGWEVAFPLAEPGMAQEPVRVFTTRADTLMGVTFIVLAPEHALVERLAQPEYREAVEAYRRQTSTKSEMERMLENREKTGVFTGSYVLHPFSGEQLPVWVADYVLPGYGSGAIMGVPAHDLRDLEFARAYGLPVKMVIAPVGLRIANEGEQEILEAMTEPGVMFHSGRFDGLDSETGAQAVGAALLEQGLGQPKVQYRMRDWLISRQRYWGTPIPILYCPDCGEVPVPEDQLPVRLPPMDDFGPDGSGRSPLARLPEFVNTTCPRCGGSAQRETDTMGGFACSSWYFLRFTSPHYHQGPFEPEAMRAWMPVDLYVGGAEHAVLHLLYARFWTKALADAGILPFREPFARLMNQGQLLAPDGQRMSKSRGNTITPDAMVASYGADALRIYELFMAPFDQDIAWSPDGISGSRRFLNRLWALYAETYAEASRLNAEDPELERFRHRTIRRATERIEGFRFNTLISTLMEFTNLLLERQRREAWRTRPFFDSLETLLLLLAPVAPHLAEELWSLTGHESSVHTQAWPQYNEALAAEETVEVPVQVDGKLRVVISAPPEAGAEAVKAAALADGKVQPFLQDRQIVNVVYVPGKVVNIVTRASKKTEEN